MGRIKVHEFITLDGVVEDPRWTMSYEFHPKMGEDIGALMGSAEALLLGRNTYEMFAPAWSTRTAQDDPGAPFFNESPKYVVSATRDTADEWKNSTVLGAYDPAAIRRLKDEHTGIYVSGSGTLVRGLLADGLVDELHLLVYPIVLGSGEKLFPDGVRRTPLALAEQEAFDNGVLHLTYTPA